MDLFSNNCKRLCSASERNRIRYFYETIRDRFCHPVQDDPKTRAQLQGSVILALTKMVVQMDLPQKDVRLTKAHVEYLFRQMQDLSGSMNLGVTAVSCLQELEDAFPTLLYKQASPLVHFAMDGTQTSVAGIKGNVTILTATVMSNLCLAYLQQQGLIEEKESLLSKERSRECALAADVLEESLTPNIKHFQSKLAFENSYFLSSKAPTSQQMPTTEVLQAAADALIDTKSNERCYNYVTSFTEGASMSETCEELDEQSNEMFGNNAIRSRGDSNNFSCDMTGDKLYGDSRTNIQSPSGVLSSHEIADSTLCSTESSRRSMLSSVIAADSMSDAPAEVNSIETSNGFVCKEMSQESLKSGSSSYVEGNDLDRSSSISSPRSAECGVANLLRSLDEESRKAGFVSFRFSVPIHIQRGHVNRIQDPKLQLDAESSHVLEKSLVYFFSIIKKISSDKMFKLGDRLVPILKSVDQSSMSKVWHAYERSIAIGNISLLRILLDIFDSVEWLTKNYTKNLLEKILRQANDQSFSPEYRATCFNWAIRQHASQCHTRADLLLKDLWVHLLPLKEDPIKIAALKIKGLASCMASGIGDEQIICRISLAYFVALHPGDKLASSSQKSILRRRSLTRSLESSSSEECCLRILTYSLRQLYASVADSGSMRYRGIAALIWSIAHAIVAKPSLAAAVDEFLNTCDSNNVFAQLLLEALDALFGAVEGSFTVLQDNPDDMFYENGDEYNGLSHRVKSALLSRASSLSGLMRGISFSLPSFSKSKNSVRNSSEDIVRTILEDGKKSKERGNSLGKNLSENNHSTNSMNNTNFSPEMLHDVFRERKLSNPKLDTNSIAKLRANVAATFVSQESPMTTFVNRNSQQTENSLRTSSTAPSSALKQQRIESHELESSKDLNKGKGFEYLLKIEQSNTVEALRQVSEVDTNFIIPTFGDISSVQVWLTDRQTWERLARGLLSQDLMAYRHLLQRIMIDRNVVALGTLQTLANYSWQYKKHNPSHVLPMKETAGAILALCQTVALCHLPHPEDEEWTDIQKEVSQTILGVIDAMEDSGFPSRNLKDQISSFGILLQDENAWAKTAQAETFTKLLGHYIDSALV